MALGTVVVTGAAGLVGSALREPLRTRVARLRLVDRVQMSAQSPVEEVRQAELSSVEAVASVLDGADAVVHLAGIPDEAPLPDLLEANVLGTHHVLEAARRTGARRVVLASSNRLTGCYPVSEKASPDMPPRPDGLYGVSKVAAEALGRLYVDKFGLQVVCLRIGSMETEPNDVRHLATWLSPRDCAGFVDAALSMPDVGFIAAYAVSANSRRFWDLSTDFGYYPKDNAEDYADRFPKTDGFFADGGPQGGEYASADYTLRHLADGS